jgi:hypothetical protein
MSDTIGGKMIEYMTNADQEELLKHITWNINYNRAKILEYKDRELDTIQNILLPLYERDLAMYQRMYNSIKLIVEVK